MFGIRGEVDRETEKFYSTARRAYTDKETGRVPVQFYTVVNEGEVIKSAVIDGDGHKVVAYANIPQKAIRQDVKAEQVDSQMGKTGGTPYYCTGVQSRVAPNLYVPLADLNDLRRRLLKGLSDARENPPVRRSLPVPAMPKGISPVHEPVDIYQVLTASQLSEELAELRPACVYVPLTEMYDHFEALKPFTDRGTVPVAVLPRVISDKQMEDVSRMLKELHAKGVNEALVGNIGQILPARRAGMKLRGDFGLNVFNSYTLEMIKKMGFISATASFELRIEQVRDLKKCMNTELIVYGRLPLMVTEQCIISRSAGKCSCEVPNQLSDRTGSVFPVVREFEHRNVIYNAHKLFMADKRSEICGAGLWGQRLMFTTESARECVMIAKSYRGDGDYRPNQLTRGLYGRGVE